MRIARVGPRRTDHFDRDFALVEESHPGAPVGGVGRAPSGVERGERRGLLLSPAEDDPV